MTLTSMQDTEICILVQDMMQQFLSELIVVVKLLRSMSTRKRKRTLTTTTYSMINKMPDQIKHLNRLVGVNDTDCIVNLRMDRNTFGRLCRLMRELGSLIDGKYVTVEEQLAIFLSILAHHKKKQHCKI